MQSFTLSRRGLNQSKLAPKADDWHSLTQSWLQGLLLCRTCRFTMRRYDIVCKRGLCCRPVSVCLEDIVKLLSRPGSPIILVFDSQRRYPIPRRTASALAQNTRERWKILRFSKEIAVYLGNGTRYALHGCYGTLIGSHMRSVEWWHFQWPWRTPNTFFKDTIFLKSNISKTVHLRDKVTIECQ